MNRQVYVPLEMTQSITFLLHYTIFVIDMSPLINCHVSGITVNVNRHIVLFRNVHLYTTIYTMIDSYCLGIKPNAWTYFSGFKPKS
jgi:hypothetical protein